jgi:uncharacterized protein
MLQPTTINERHSILDSLRGFALLGVILANMVPHSGYFFLSDAQKELIGVSSVDSTVEWVMNFLVDGKFYSLFSLLFGVGFALQMKKSEERSMKFTAHYSKRLTILFFIGLLHAILFFVGDILTVYALVGFVLLLFRKCSNRAILIWALILLILPVVQYLFYWLPAVMSTAEPGIDSTVRPPFFDIVIQTYQTGNVVEIIQMNFGGLLFGRYPDLFFTGRFFKVLAMFLIGVYVTRNLLFVNLEAKRGLLFRVLIIGLVIGIPCNYVLAMMMETDAYHGLSARGIIQPIVYSLGVPALSLAYAAAIGLVSVSRNRNVLLVFTPLGRMALTNYLFQSVIACTIFMNYGLGLYAQLTPLHLLFAGLAIYTSQIVFSYVWLLYFQFGPAEWLWRCLTYRQWLPIRKPGLVST